MGKTKTKTTTKTTRRTAGAPRTIPGYKEPAPTLPETPEFRCPAHFPGTGAECSLTGMWVGTCYWSSSAQAGEMPNSEGRECDCNTEGNSKFSCRPVNRD